jgi:hypothetical protein
MVPAMPPCSGEPAKDGENGTNPRVPRSVGGCYRFTRGSDGHFVLRIGTMPVGIQGDRWRNGVRSGLPRMVRRALTQRRRGPDICVSTPQTVRPPRRSGQLAPVAPIEYPACFIGPLRSLMRNDNEVEAGQSVADSMKALARDVLPRAGMRPPRRVSPSCDAMSDRSKGLSFDGWWSTALLIGPGCDGGCDGGPGLGRVLTPVARLPRVSALSARRQLA